MTSQPPPGAVVLHGVPDDRVALLARDARSNQPAYSIAGTCGFRSHIQGRVPGLTDAFIGPGFELKLPDAPVCDLINYIADADRCGIALELAKQLVAAPARRCFNTPAAVLRSTRDASAALLADLPGIDMPRTVRFKPASPEEIGLVAGSTGMGFPVLARIAGDHGGVSLVRLDAADHLAPLHGIPWGGRELYLTQFRDFRDPDGRYRKIRLAIVGRQYFVRHLVIGDGWLLHAARRSVEDEREEQQFLASFDRLVRPQLDPVIERIIDAVGLDYFGIDCSLRPDGRLLVFEVNACMNILHNSQPSPNIWDAPIAAILDALCLHLAAPEQWVGTRTEAEVTA